MEPTGMVELQTQEECTPTVGFLTGSTFLSVGKSEQMTQDVLILLELQLPKQYNILGKVFTYQRVLLC
jgi:hypothetical protein